jgi:hypothetical protein
MNDEASDMQRVRDDKEMNKRNWMRKLKGLRQLTLEGLSRRVGLC